MRTRRIAAAAALVLSATALASAQSLTRDQDARDARDAKAQTTAAARAGRIERFLKTVERRVLPQDLVLPFDGFGVRIGGIDDDDGRFALGPAWRSSLADGHVVVYSSAAMSVRRDREIDFGVKLPQFAAGRTEIGLRVTGTELAAEGFYGLGNDSLPVEPNVFALARRSVTAAALFKPGRAIALEASSGLLRTRLRDLGGFDTFGFDVDYVHSRVAATLDYRDQPGNPRRGGRYHVALHRFDGSPETLASFNRIDAELEQHLPVWKKQQMVTLRAVASFSHADEGHYVPFYMQRTLGGSRFLRGFVHDRFRDRNFVVLQSEYGWDISPFLNAVLFYETGMVARHARDLALAKMHRDYGFGLRFGSARYVALRTDVAFGAEGARFSVRFGHAF